MAILSYTYGINDNGYDLSGIENHVNLLKPYSHRKSSRLKKIVPVNVKRRIRKIIRIAAGKPTLNVSIDNLNTNTPDDKYCESIRNDIVRAKNEADLVCVCTHMGGQFNTNVGDFSKYMAYVFSQAGADLIVGNHAHIVQNFVSAPTPTAFCLGGFTISPSASYLVHDNLPEYSVILHIYCEEAIQKMTFTIMKVVEDSDGMVMVWPVDELYKVISGDEREELVKQVTVIYNRFLSCSYRWEDFEIQREFDIT